MSRPWFLQLAGRLGAAMLLLACTACHSELGEAVITMSGDQPCFSVSSDRSTRAGIALYGVTVTTHTPNVSAPETVHWKFSIEPAGKSIPFSSRECIRYGSVPKTGVQSDFKPLEPYTIYFVYIEAKPPKSPVFSYDGLFCLKPGPNGKMALQVVSTDNSLGESRYDVCRKPPQ